MKVTLLTYQDLQVPAGVLKVDASLYVEEHKFKAHLKEGVPVQALADFIRMNAVCKHGGWVIDGDSIWVRRPPVLGLGNPEFLGHFFGSMKQSPYANNGQTNEQKTKWWLLNYTKDPGDRLFIATPMAFPKGSLAAQSWLRSAEDILTNHKFKYYIDFMKLFASTVQEHGLTRSIAEWQVCSPVEYYHGRSALNPASRHKFDLSHILHSSICVNNFWQSSKGRSAHESDEFEVVCGSFWHELLLFVEDQSRHVVERRLTGKRAYRPQGLQGGAQAEACPALVEACPTLAEACPAQVSKRRKEASSSSDNSTEVVPRQCDSCETMNAKLETMNARIQELEEGNRRLSNEVQQERSRRIFWEGEAAELRDKLSHRAGPVRDLLPK